MQLLHRAQEFEAQGMRVVHFEVGEPDFTTAPPIIEAGVNALRSGQTKYTAAQGIQPLREKISGYYRDQCLDVPISRIHITFFV